MSSWVTRTWGRLRRPPRATALVELRREQWNALLAELAERGDGRRESGAFLLADRSNGSRLVSEVLYFDDLDPDCLTGGIHLHRRTFSKLWDICADRGMHVIADVHTHPSPHVAQSGTDRANPMISRTGHVGLIVPNLAQGAIEPRDVGLHIYRGDDGWTSFFEEDAANRLRLVGRR